MIHTCVTQFTLDSSAVDFRIDRSLESLDFFTVDIPRCFLKHLPDNFYVRFSNFDNAVPIYNYLGNWLYVEPIKKYLIGNKKCLDCYRGLDGLNNQSHTTVLTKIS